MRLPAFNFVQTCYVVPDLEAACERVHRLIGAGPFLGGDPFTLDRHVYRGRPADPIRLRGVFGQCGEMVVEILQILSDGPSAFAESTASGSPMLHHMAAFCDDYEAQRDRLVAAGYPVASEFVVNGSIPICYIDTIAELGHMIELYPEHPAIRGMYALTRAAAGDRNQGRLIQPWPAQ
jgi:hypothetical protein